MKHVMKQDIINLDVTKYIGDEKLYFFIVSDKMIYHFK